MKNNEVSIPIRLKELATIKCIAHGEVEIDLQQIKYLRTIPADDGDTTQVHMNSGESYYVRGKNQFQLAEQLGIVLKAAI